MKKLAAIGLALIMTAGLCIGCCLLYTSRLTSLLDQAGAKYFLEGPRYLYYNAADTSTEYRRSGEQLGGSFKPVLRLSLIHIL